MMKRLNGAFVLLLFYSFAFFSAADDSVLHKPELTRMLYNNPGLVDDLAVGLWSWPIPADFNGDGKTDLIVCCDCTPYNGVFLFENPGILPERPGQGTAPESSKPVFHPSMPIFKAAGAPISHANRNLVPSWIDGKLHVLRRGVEYPHFTEKGENEKVSFSFDADSCPDGRGNMWKFVDFNGDGLIDLTVGADDWGPYGWANSYDENGVWKNSQVDGFVFILINKGTNDNPVYEKAFRLNTLDGKPINQFGWPNQNFIDFDGDGDLDLLCGEFIDRFTYFENVGTAQEPKYAPGTFILGEDGELIRDNLCMETPVVIDWTGDGFPDIIAGNEDGRISLFENTGRFQKQITGEGNFETEVQVPIFKRQLFFQQEANELKASSLATPCCVDLDQDGAIDIVTGTTEGTILFFKNLSEPGTEFPKWARPVYLKARGHLGEQVIRISAGPNGSIQGPIERKYGYTTVTVADWDGDGLLDIMANSVLGKVVWFKNIGSPAEPVFDAPCRVDVEWDEKQPRLAWGWMTPENDTEPVCVPPERFPEKPGTSILTQWRTTPVMYDWNNDGLMDLSMLDTEGYFVLFERYRDTEGNLKLKAPQRVFKNADGTPLRLNSESAGASGRRKICVTDWDGDGKPDLIVNSKNADVLHNVSTREGEWIFVPAGTLSSTVLAGHSTSPTPADFNGDGIPDLVIGAEDGRFYYLRNSRAEKE